MFKKKNSGQFLAPQVAENKRKAMYIVKTKQQYSLSTDIRKSLKLLCSFTFSAPKFYIAHLPLHGNRIYNKT
jgi:hypothetical protein